MFYMRFKQWPCNSPDFVSHPRIGGGYDNLAIEAALRQCDGNWQTMGDLVNLVVVKEESDPHIAVTPRRTGCLSYF